MRKKQIELDATQYTFLLLLLLGIVDDIDQYPAEVRPTIEGVMEAFFRATKVEDDVP